MTSSPFDPAGAEVLGELHAATSVATPLRADAFDRSDAEKVAAIAPLFGQIMDIIGLDRSDESLAGTPHRVAKMYVEEIFRGLHTDRMPEARSFPNDYGYREMLVERDIAVHSTCEHHFLPIVGRAHVAYKSSGRVIGLSKLNRIVDHFSRRPQVQERLTRQISEALCEALATDDVAVVVDARHFCVSSRGIGDVHSSTVTAEYSGCFRDAEVRKEFFALAGLRL
jgi:GTP cyclohydrolase I